MWGVLLGHAAMGLQPAGHWDAAGAEDTGLCLGWQGWGGLPAPCPSPTCPLPPCSRQCTFAPGHVIIHEGDEGQNFYIILKGEVGATPQPSTGDTPHHSEGQGRALCTPPPLPTSHDPCPVLSQVQVTQRVAGQEQPIRVLGAGQHFGEISLLRFVTLQ